MSEFSAPNPDYQETVKRLLLEMPYVAWLGITFERIAPGQVELQMPHRLEITFDGNAVQAWRWWRFTCRCTPPRDWRRQWWPR